MYCLNIKVLKFLIKKEIKLISIIFLYLMVSAIISGETYSIESFVRYLRFLPFLIVLYFLFNTDKSFEISLLKIFNIYLFSF